MAVKENFEYESLHDAASIGEYLKALRKGIAKGEIHFTSGDDELILQPNDLVHLSVRARRKGRDSLIQIKIMWKEPDQDSGDPDKETLGIS
jgi:amphi-Trp domain-containing protein